MGLQLELFRPVSLMLASPVDTAAELVEVFPSGRARRGKFDGIRAQVHKRDDKVEIYSRTLDRVTEFPELAPAIRRVPGDFILDGEIIGWRDGRAIPFTELQQRLGRKQIDLFTATMVPVSFIAFDLLLLNDEPLLDLELAERRLQLTELLSAHERQELRYTRAGSLHHGRGNRSGVCVGPGKGEMRALSQALNRHTSRGVAGNSGSS